jgi:hypothetical protein
MTSNIRDVATGLEAHGMELKLGIFGRLTKGKIVVVFGEVKMGKVSRRNNSGKVK